MRILLMKKQMRAMPIRARTRTSPFCHQARNVTARHLTPAMSRQVSFAYLVLVCADWESSTRIWGRAMRTMMATMNDRL